VLAPGFERRLRLPSEVGLPTYQRAHLWGPGFGDEARLGIMYAPEAVNQAWQNRGVEQAIRDLSALVRQFPGAELRVRAAAHSYPLADLPPALRSALRSGEDVLQSVTYRFQAVAPNGRVLEEWRVDIDVGLPPRGRVEVLVDKVP
jgi:hypothetical protein